MVDYSKIISHKAMNIKPSGIRKFFDIVNTMEDAISLGVGEPDFDTPWQIRKAGISSIEKGSTFYTSNWGLLELRGQIHDYMLNKYNLNYNVDREIVVTVGGSEAIDNALRAIITDGDEVLIPEPSFVCYTPLAIMAGGVPVPICTSQEDNFTLTANALRDAITPKTKVLILPFPNNPTGAIMTRQQLKDIANVLKDTNIIVISDEIYSELTYSIKHVCFAEITGMKERTIVINGFSKSFAMTGWRLGFVCAPRELTEIICKLHQYGIMSAPTVSQFAGTEALKSCMSDTERMRDEYNLRRVYILSELSRIGLECFTPLGAFYVFPSIKSTGLSSEDFSTNLLKSQKIAVVPGNAFGESGEGFIRISYSYSMKHIKEAISRIERFLTSLK